MEIDISRREEYYQEYLLLKNNPDYTDVTLDQLSGGFSAIHKEHCFDKQVGPFGCPRGRYELDVACALRMNGFRVILESEYPKGKKIKAYDAKINGKSTEIKTVESNGRWSIRTKIHDAINQGAEMLVLYFPSKSLFSRAKIIEGWNYNKTSKLDRILAVVEGDILEMLKPPG